MIITSRLYDDGTSNSRPPPRSSVIADRVGETPGFRTLGARPIEPSGHASSIVFAADGYIPRTRSRQRQYPPTTLTTERFLPVLVSGLLSENILRFTWTPIPPRVIVSYSPSFETVLSFPDDLKGLIPCSIVCRVWSLTRHTRNGYSPSSTLSTRLFSLFFPKGKIVFPRNLSFYFYVASVFFYFYFFNRFFTTWVFCGFSRIVVNLNSFRIVTVDHCWV